MRYLKTYESVLSDSIKDELIKRINWELIQDAKDAALDYIDGGDTLLIYIDCGRKYFYDIEFNHSINRNEWIDDWTDVDLGGDISYVIKLVNGGIGDYKNTQELRDRLNGMYPNEFIKRNAIDNIR